MVADRLRRHRGQLLLDGVIAAHEALQFRELADHAGCQVGLAEPGGQGGLGRIGAHPGRQGPGQALQPLDPFGKGAQPGVEGHGLQLFQPGLQADLPVFIPEETRIGQAGGQDLGVARSDDRPAIGRGDVGYRDKVRREAAGGGIPHSEVLLVIAHGCADHLRRQGQEVRVHVAQDRDRPFHQAGHLVQKPGVLHQLQPPVRAKTAGFDQDAQLAVLGVEENESPFQPRAVAGETLDPEGTVRAHEPVADREVHACDPIHVERNGCAPEDAEHMPEGAYPAEGPGSPGHGLRPGKVSDDVRNDLGDDLGRGAAGRRQVCKPDAVALDQLVSGQAGGAEKALKRRVRGGGPGSLALFLPVRLGRCDPFGDESEATGPSIGAEGLRLQTGRREPLTHHAVEVAGRLGLHARRDLLREELNQQLGHGQTPSAGTLRPSFATQASAHILVRSRMRPI